jgi:hypothetical protein
MSQEEIRRKGDRFTFVFLLVFLFIHLGIILPGQQPSAVIEELSRAQQHIDHQRSELEDQLGEREPEAAPGHSVAAGRIWLSLPRLSTIGDPIARRETSSRIFASTDAEEPAKVTNPVLLEADLNKVKGEKENEEESPAEQRELPSRKDAQERLIELDLKYIDLERQKSAKTFSLPVLNIGVEAQVVLLLYPAFVFVGLLGILKNRSDFLNSAKPIVKPPFWAMPLPLPRGADPTWERIAWNTFSLAGHWLVLYIVADFLLNSETKKLYTAPALAVNFVLAAVTLVSYLAMLTSVIGQDVMPLKGKAT